MQSTRRFKYIRFGREKQLWFQYKIWKAAGIISEDMDKLTSMPAVGKVKQHLAYFKVQPNSLETMVIKLVE